MTAAESLAPALVALRGITKRFPAVLANDAVDLDIRVGEVHALLGENGAGKSTLLKILYGFYRADSGAILHQGRPVRVDSPQAARALRIGMVFQDFTLIPAMTAAENVALFLDDLGPVLDHGRVAERMLDVANKFRLTVAPSARVGDLSVGERQKVEIIKLLLSGSRVLILDEPTKVLAPHEIDGLFDVFGRLKTQGYAIVFVTHKLREVLSCADHITVMRRGKVAGTMPRAQADQGRLVELMFGSSEGADTAPARPAGAPGAETLIELRGAATRAEGDAVALAGIDLAVHTGEIVGVAGVSGNGQRELGDLLMGLMPAAAGSKLLLGRQATHWPPSRVRACGVGFIPEDALAMAAVPWFSVAENMLLGNTARYGRRRGFALARGEARQDLLASYRRLGMEPPALDGPARALSGGNLQRMVVARELARELRLLIAFYPTRGLDVPSAEAVRRSLLRSRDGGCGVLLISEDLDELFALSDLLLVLHRGRIVGRLRPRETSLGEVGHLMTGSGGES